jgi:hypothetical protein
MKFVLKQKPDYFFVKNKNPIKSFCALCLITVFIWRYFFAATCQENNLLLKRQIFTNLSS